MKFLKQIFGKAPSAGTATLQRGADNVYVLRISGLINKATVDRIQSIGAEDFQRGIKDLKVLILLSDFRGWKRGDNWGDIDFFARYEAQISKIAVVGDPRWETEINMFLAAGHRTGEVRFFSPEHEPQARTWLAGRPD